MPTRFAAAIMLSLASLTLAAAASAATLTEDDYRKVVSLRSPVLSPDGKRGVFIAGRIDWDADKVNSDLVLVDLATHAQRTLTYGRKGLSDPAFSPDGTRLAFLAVEGTGEDAQSQVFVMPLDGGDAKPVTHAKGGVDQFAWRPDGRAIAYASSDAEPDRKGAEKYKDSFVFTTEPIVARELPQPSHLFVVALADGTTSQLTTGSQSVATGEAQSTISWSRDGSAIAFTIAPNAILNDQSYSRVAVVDVATKAVHPLTGRSAWEGTPLFSPDGAHIAYTYSDGDNQVNLVHLYVTAPAGGDGVAISKPVDRPVASVAWSRDSRAVYFTVPDHTTVALFRAALGGAPQRVDLGDLVIGSELDGAIGPDGSLLFIASKPTSPPELYLRSAGGAIAKLTDLNAAIAARDLSPAQRITFPTSLGTQADGVLILPPAFKAGTKYPLVLFVHGGPTSESTLGFDFWGQVMAARGWLVLRPNYRGSDDLGLAYQRAVLYDPEEGPGKDIMAAVDSVRARGIVDDSKLAVGGWSYGGIMTAWMISKYHVWKAAVSGASVDDWAADYGTADDSLSDMDLFHGSPFVGDNAAEYRRASAISYVADVTTPVLILSDVGDNRDSFATSSMYWRALRDNKKDATLRVWPVNGHFPRDPVRAADVYHYWIEYIAQHFGAAGK